jgi:hypothetical protein
MARVRCTHQTNVAITASNHKRIGEYHHVDSSTVVKLKPTKAARVVSEAKPKGKGVLKRIKRQRIVAYCIGTVAIVLTVLSLSPLGQWCATAYRIMRTSGRGSA